MILDFGIVRPGTTLYIPFHTFDSNDPSASVTLTGLAVTDIEVYRDGSTTQRASDTGYSLLDTDGIDFDGITGIHGFSINLASNATAGFFRGGSQYWVVVSSVTVDGATINFVAATFRIGYPGAYLNTYMATRASQTSFTIPSAQRPADDDALNGWACVIHDVDSAADVQIGYVSDYTGSTGTVTLAADPGVFTTAANDTVAFYPPANVGAVAGTAQTAGNIIADTEAVLADTEAAVPVLADTEAILTDSESILTDSEAILTDTEAAVPVLTDTEAILSDSEAVLADTEAAVPVLTDTEAILSDTEASQTAETSILADTEAVLTDAEAIVADTNELQTDWADGGRLDLILDARASQASLDALNDLSAAEVNAEVVDVLKTDTIAELSGVPSATPTFEDALMFLYMALRNRRDTTATADEIHNDAGTAIATSTLSDDATTFTKGEYA